MPRLAHIGRVVSVVYSVRQAVDDVGLVGSEAADV
jgi:hypothetical protein